MKADLHMHSTDSDGRLSTLELFKYAKARGLDVVAVTDHDVCKNVEEKKKIAEEIGITYLPGIELSTLYKGKSVHILGFFRDDAYNSEAMKEYYHTIKEGREKRAKKFVENLKFHYDIEISYERVMEISSGIVARPHIARAIMEQYPGYGHDEIFEKFIGEDCKAFVPSTELTTDEGLKLLRDNNALAVLAHPKLLKKSIADDVLAYGYDGIEAIYGMNTEAETIHFKRLARKRGWLITAGSDFHGIKNDPSHADLGDVALEGDALKAFLEALQ